MPALMRPPQTKGYNVSCKCQNCGNKYKVDLIVEDYIWKNIKPIDKPRGTGLLCGCCIIKKIEKKYGYFTIQTIKMRTGKQNNQGLWKKLEKLSPYDFLNYIKNQYIKMFNKKLTYKTISLLTKIKIKTLEGYFSKGKYPRKFPWVIKRLLYLEILRYRHLGNIYTNKKNNQRGMK